GAGVERVELYAKGPRDSAYSMAGSASAAEGSLAYQAGEGPGDYSFYTVAYDAVGHAEPTASQPGAVTTLIPRTRPVEVASGRLAGRRDGSIAVVLANPNPFAVTGRLTVETARAFALRAGGPERVRRVGTAAFAIAEGARATIEVPVRAALREAIARRGSIPVRIRRTASGAGGSSTLVTVARLRAAAFRRR
ncbi:MAG: hypothetical protein ACJ760_10715, partial [Thermoleophilaceae bacterium]